MEDSPIHVGDKVELTDDISILGVLTLHTGSTGVVEHLENGVAQVRIDGLGNVSVDAKIDILLRVG